MSLKFSVLASVAGAFILSCQAEATVVRFETSLGNFDVNLYDRRTPATVANFLAYVGSGAYSKVVMHRSEVGFVVQSGGYTYQGSLPFANIVERAAVANEPVFSNVRATIAMAKLSGNPNSATSQWFINMGNNSANLDVQNGGFTVFGQVTGSGMAVLDAINALQTFQLTSAITALPLRNYTANAPVTDQNLVIASSVYVLDSNVDSAASLTPVANTLITAPPAATPAPAAPSGGGGAAGPGSLLLLGVLALGRLRRRGQPAASSHLGSPPTT